MSMGYATDLIEMLDAVMRSLPHGSGIDYTWYVHHITYVEDEDGGEVDMSFTNSYHATDEYDGYCCIIPFKATVTFIPAPTISLGSWFVGVDIEEEKTTVEEDDHIRDEHWDMEEYLQQQVELYLIEGMKSLGYKFVP